MMTISKDSVVVAVKSQVSCQVDAETVVLHFDQGVYFWLNEVGTLIWNQVQQPRKVQEIRDTTLASMKINDGTSLRADLATNPSRGR